MDNSIKIWLLQHWIVTAVILILMAFIVIRVLSLIYQAFISFIDQILLKIVQIPTNLLTFCFRHLPFGAWIKAKFLKASAPQQTAQPESLVTAPIATPQTLQPKFTPAFTSDQYADILAQLQAIRTQQTQLELLLMQLIKAQSKE